ncbi:MAG: hypothetical protein Q9M31_01455 [Mariprofundus sp.]|nr:hypothetical protein [Mariprofundus sp.]
MSWVLEQFGGSHERYQVYVANEARDDSPLANAVGTHVLGDELFRCEIQHPS